MSFSSLHTHTRCNARSHGNCSRPYILQSAGCGIRLCKSDSPRAAVCGCVVMLRCRILAVPHHQNENVQSICSTAMTHNLCTFVATLVAGMYPHNKDVPTLHQPRLIYIQPGIKTTVHAGQVDTPPPPLLWSTAAAAAAALHAGRRYCCSAESIPRLTCQSSPPRAACQWCGALDSSRGPPALPQSLSTSDNITTFSSPPGEQTRPTQPRRPWPTLCGDMAGGRQRRCGSASCRQQACWSKHMFLECGADFALPPWAGRRSQSTLAPKEHIQHMHSLPP